ncbi:MAG TPA: hypothetical protein DCL41_07025 [Bdellovibrionales bacterium]|nr:hypothetical protein [Pseudobdellovibrionaceae bacterium]HAG91606.1 hypothetical protein [Bdellovibrionales bacterium]
MNQRFKVWSRLMATILVSSFVIQSKVLAEDFEYPELNVTPLASERLKMEALRENSSSEMWMDHVPVFIPATLNLIAAIKLNSQKSDFSAKEQKDAEDTTRVAFGVSAFWIGYSSYLAMTYRPFSDATTYISRMEGNSKKAHLIRERLAEERIKESARFGRMLSWISSGTLLASSLAVASKAKTDAEAIAIVSAVSALSPLIFRYRWEKVEDYHSEYKKRIYGPVVTSGLYGKKIEGETHWAPQLLVSYQF